MNYPVPSGQGRPRLQVVAGEAALDGQWASDHCNAGRLGIPARRGRGHARFDGISQPWLRDPVKRWSRFRLATGCAFTTIGAGALALTRFSRFLATCHPEAGEPGAITRPVLEDYLPWLLTQGYSAATRALSLSMIRVFSDACHRYGWLPGLAANATIYVEDSERIRTPVPTDSVHGFRGFRTAWRADGGVGARHAPSDELPSPRRACCRCRVPVSTCARSVRYCG